MSIKSRILHCSRYKIMCDWLKFNNYTTCNKELCFFFRTVENVLAVHKVNVVGPMLVTQAMLPLLRKGSKKLVG